MRDMFRSYYKPTEEDFERMWSDGIFAFDTNVLLNFYRYTPETTNRLIEILRQINDRIWIPHQVALEYHERRLDVISDQFKASESIEKQLEKSLQEIENELRRHNTHAFANVDQLLKIIQDAMSKAKDSLKEARNNHPDFLKRDSLLETITDLFENKVGKPYSDEELNEFYKEAEQRFGQNIPPGFEDRKKEGTKKYGDTLIWYQLIDHMKVERKPLIFITGDRKEDWWLRHNGRTIGPRRELIQEMYNKAGVPFYMYLTDQFIERAEKLLGVKNQNTAIEEIREIRQRDESKRRSLDTKATTDEVASRWSKAEYLARIVEHVVNNDSPTEMNLRGTLYREILRRTLMSLPDLWSTLPREDGLITDFTYIEKIQQVALQTIKFINPTVLKLSLPDSEARLALTIIRDRLQKIADNKVYVDGGKSLKDFNNYLKNTCNLMESTCNEYLND